MLEIGKLQFWIKENREQAVAECLTEKVLQVAFLFVG